MSERLYCRRCGSITNNVYSGICYDCSLGPQRARPSSIDKIQAESKSTNNELKRIKTSVKNTNEKSS